MLEVREDPLKKYYLKVSAGKGMGWNIPAGCTYIWRLSKDGTSKDLRIHSGQGEHKRMYLGGKMGYKLHLEGEGAF